MRSLLFGRVVRLTEDVSFSKWQGHHDPAIEGVWPAGTTVKVVMVSRFWVVGITDDLTANSGYHACVRPGILTWDGITEDETRELSDYDMLWVEQQEAFAQFSKRRVLKD